LTGLRLHVALPAKTTGARSNENSVISRTNENDAWDFISQFEEEISVAVKANFTPAEISKRR
jgi:hypothetical protein